MSSLSQSKPQDHHLHKGETIKVAIRVRPLINSKETPSGHRVWRTFPQFNSIIQTEPEPPYTPVAARIPNKNFFEFDKTFDEDSTTKDVYENTTQSLVQSFMQGWNSSVFAYGQTSSGKTYTMQGDKKVLGIIHMAARDIFSHIIQNEKTRKFLIKASYLEIYNEEVRDLLAPGTPTVLSIRESARKGVFVNANQVIVTNYDGLISSLYEGEKKRKFASTEMNERSSRSHTIFRITVESQLKSKDDYDDNDDNSEETEENSSTVSSTSLSQKLYKTPSKNHDDDDDSSIESFPIMTSTLDLVDLAGSESVRHSGATKERAKEGGKINQSLLTLSRVIVGLGQSNAHINFRDSKLTRLLQPTLSGNARISIICCATSSHLFLEETRSTLLFASRAKLVKTNPQREEYLDDHTLHRKMLKKLKKELDIAKNALGGDNCFDNLVKLQSENKSLNDEVETLKGQFETSSSESNLEIHALREELESSKMYIASLKKEIEELINSKSDLQLNLSKSLANQEISLNQVKDLMSENQTTQQKLKEVTNDNIDSKKHITTMKEEIERIKEESNKLNERVCVIDEERNKLLCEKNDATVKIEKLQLELGETTERLEITESEKSSSDEKIRELTEVVVALEADKKNILQTKDSIQSELTSCQEERDQCLEQVKSLQKEKDIATSTILEITSERDALEESTKKLLLEKNDATVKIEKLQLELGGTTERLDIAESEKSSSDEKIKELTEVIVALEADKENILQTKDSIQTQLNFCQGERDQCLEQVKSLQKEKDIATSAIVALEADKENILQARDSIQTQLRSCQEERDQCLEQVKSLQKEKDIATSAIVALEAEKENILQTRDSIQTQLRSCQGERDQCLEQVKSLQKEKDIATSTILEITSERNALEESTKKLFREKNDATVKIEKLQLELGGTTERLNTAESEKSLSEEKIKELTEVVVALEADKGNILQTRDSIQTQLRSCQGERDQCLEQVKSLQKEKDIATSTIRDITAGKNKFEERVKFLEEQLCFSKSNIESMQKENELLQRKNTDFEGICSNLKKALEEEKLSYAELKRNSLQMKETANALQTVKDKTTMKNRELMEKITQSETERDELKSRIDELDSHLKKEEKGHKVSLSSVKRYKAELIELAEKHYSLKKAARETVRENKSLKESIASLTEKIKFLLQERKEDSNCEIGEIICKTNLDGQSFEGESPMMVSMSEFETMLKHYEKKIETIKLEKLQILKREKSMAVALKNSNATLKTTKSSLELVEQHRNELTEKLEGLSLDFEKLKNHMMENQENYFS